MDHFNNDYSVPTTTGLLLLIHAVNVVAQYANPILGFISVSLSIFYISLKIYTEFFKDKNKQ
jgi:hypothetical protein